MTEAGADVAPPALAPRSREELLASALGLAGQTLDEIATKVALLVPPDLSRNKGFVGQLIERALGAPGGSKAGPDFAALGVELKTLPVDARGVPLESTFVCTLPLGSVGDLEWHDSPVKKKLDCVLWVPVEGERARPLGVRRVGTALLWNPTTEEEQDLKHDWDELTGLIGRGQLEAVTAHLGRSLQVRPKAADGNVRRGAYTFGEGRSQELPRGFYLRARFTARILSRHFAL